MSDLPTPPPPREITPEDLFQDGLMQILRERLQLTVNLSFDTNNYDQTRLQVTVALFDKGNPNLPKKPGESMELVAMANSTVQMGVELTPFNAKIRVG